ncbi:hypothetical protein T10_12179 [Trichinella papuae]|uniref:Uncharacterized protein n=1 Tax=Trichinella papuae TaxID=268474 RepID=A0A0V1LZH2_9BILA|nr:hypothetical protein T10_12179 [Trichinella papuae]
MLRLVAKQAFTCKLFSSKRLFVSEIKFHLSRPFLNFEISNSDMPRRVLTN